MKNTQELTIKEAKEALGFLEQFYLNERSLTEEGKARVEQLKQFLNKKENDIKEVKEALELLQKSEGNLTKEGKERIEQLEQVLKR